MPKAITGELTNDDMLATAISPPNRGANGETTPEPQQHEPHQNEAEETPQPNGNDDGGQAESHPVASSSFLSQVTTGVTLRSYRMLWYGPGGIGKSYCASQIPGHIFMDLEQGTGHLAKATRLPVPRNLEDVRTQIRELATMDHPFSCLVIDSADRLEAHIEDEVCREEGKDAIDEIGYGKGHGMVGSKWNSILSWLTRLWEVKGMNVIIIAHNTVAKFQDPMMADYDRHQIRLGKKSAPLVFEWADLCLFGNYKRQTMQEDAGFGAVKNRVLHTEERVWYTQDHPAAAAKSRIELPTEIPMSWEALNQYL